MTAGPGRPRPALEGIPAYRPGRVPQSGGVKLSSNESPFDPLPSVREALAAASGEAHRYPDHFAVALRHALAVRHGLEPAQVAVGCGSVGLIHQLVAAYADPDDDVVYGWRSFEAYPVLSQSVGACRREVPLRRMTINVPAIGRAVTDRTKLVLLATPNNPTATVISAAAVDELLEGVPDTCLVVLDEAYAEFVTHRGAAHGRPLLETHPNVVVLRTFSKAYGLAGLRVGYALGHPAVVETLDKVLTPFAVNALGQRAAMASLAGEDELLARVDAVVAERRRVARELLNLGWGTPWPQGNFVWLPAGDVTDELGAALEDLGVTVRAYAPDGLRVTVGSPADNDRFLEAFDSLTGTPVGDRAAASWGLTAGDDARGVGACLDRADAAEQNLVDATAAAAMPIARLAHLDELRQALTELSGPDWAAYTRSTPDPFTDLVSGAGEARSGTGAAPRRG